MAKQYGSEALAAAHETAQGLADAGVMAKRTMKAFDEMCLTPVEEMPPEKIRALRLRENASQAVFARHLNVTAGLVSQVGARRETPAWRLPETPDTGREERPRRGCVRPELPGLVPGIRASPSSRSVARERPRADVAQAALSVRTVLSGPSPHMIHTRAPRQPARKRGSIPTSPCPLS